MSVSTQREGGTKGRDPLRFIVSRNLRENTETLECGHTITQPLSLGEFAQSPSKAKRRRCYCCGPTALSRATATSEVER